MKIKNFSAMVVPWTKRISIKSEFDIGESVVGVSLEEANVDFEYKCESILSKGSLDMTYDDR